MTTIVATRTQLGGDAMVHVEAKHQWYPTVKVRRYIDANNEPFLVGSAGNADDCVKLLDWFEAGMEEDDRPDFDEESGSEDEAIAVMVDKVGIYCMMASSGCWELVDREFHAVGSGAKAALGYFVTMRDMGKKGNIETALKVAAEVCPYTRAPFTILSLKG